jgi:hypothetical protein
VIWRKYYDAACAQGAKIIKIRKKQRRHVFYSRCLFFVKIGCKCSAAHLTFVEMLDITGEICMEAKAGIRQHQGIKLKLAKEFVGFTDTDKKFRELAKKPESARKTPSTPTGTSCTCLMKSAKSGRQS